MALIAEGSDVSCQCASKICKHTEQKGKISPIHTLRQEVEINGDEKAFYFTCNKCGCKTKAFVKATKIKDAITFKWTPEIPKPKKTKQGENSGKSKSVVHETLSWKKRRIEVRLIS